MNDDLSTEILDKTVETGDRQEMVRLNFDQVKPTAQKPKPVVKPKKRRSNLLLNLLIWVVVALVIVALALVISAFIAGFNSVFEMIDWIVNQLR